MHETLQFHDMVNLKWVNWWKEIIKH